MRRMMLALVLVMLAGCSGAVPTPEPTPAPSWTQADVDACMVEWERAFRENASLGELFGGHAGNIAYKSGVADDLDAIATWAERFPWHYADRADLQTTIVALRAAATSVRAPMAVADWEQATIDAGRWVEVPAALAFDACKEISSWVDHNVLVP